MIMGLFEGIGDAEIFERGKYFPPDFKGVIEVRRVIMKKTRSVGLAFIVETRVIEVERSGKPDNKWSPVHVGEKRSWFQKMTDPDVALPAIKEWAAACQGFYPHEKDAIESEVEPDLEEALDHATAEENQTDNLFTEVLLSLSTDQIETRNKREFTRHAFEPYDKPEAEPTDAIDEIAE